MSIERVEIACGGYRAEILDLGATLRRLVLPDGANVVLGFADLDDYLGPPLFYGAIAGRYANRIGGARFSLDGVEYRLAANDGENSLHSGPRGFDQQRWEIAQRDDRSVTLRHVSPDGTNGFPGTLTSEARYEIGADGLAVSLRATTDRPTVVNLTHHAYFNLAGEDSGASVRDHVLQLPASRFTPTMPDAIPTGELRDVAGTAFDFRSPKPVGRDIDAADPQLEAARGYDHNFVLDAADGARRRVATVWHPRSGRVLDVQSTAPGVQFYSGNYLGGAAPGTSGGDYRQNSGLCLEPQLFPDSPNRAEFPSARLDPGAEYRHDIAFRFRTAANEDEAFG
ncbi:aldose epimerase family protein [Sphingomonas sp. MMS12-HWE2-04]|uniref:aldose epimerase family protein n=1 Tax=Sphingomonas sp. MMS12-HWE2-04 TaxID=3234199 RepID=UPI00384E54E7